MTARFYSLVFAFLHVGLSVAFFDLSLTELVKERRARQKDKPNANLQGPPVSLNLILGNNLCAQNRLAI